MGLADIICWTVSFILALLGIGFGFVASVQSSRANRKIKELISSSWAVEETQRLFFDNIKAVSLINNQCIALLDSKKKVTYREYSMHAAQGRLIPLNGKVLEIVAQTEFKDLAHSYITIKKTLDDMFFETIGDLSVLSEATEIPKTAREKLIRYHKEVVKDASHIIRSYNHILGATETVSLK